MFLFLFFISTLTKDTNTVFFIIAYNISKHPKEIRRRGISDAPNKKRQNVSFFLSTKIRT